MWSPRAEAIRPDGGKRSCRGFSLLEVGVAMAVAGLLMSVALPAARQASSRMKDAARQQAAAQVAANAVSRLSGFGAPIALPAAGSEAGLEWRINLAGEQAGGAPGTRLLSLRVTVHEPGHSAPRVDFETRRLVFIP